MSNKRDVEKPTEKVARKKYCVNAFVIIHKIYVNILGVALIFCIICQKCCSWFLAVFVFQHSHQTFWEVKLMFTEYLHLELHSFMQLFRFFGALVKGLFALG